MRKQQPGMPPFPGHHPSSKEMQLWQQQLVYKQIQELQRQQQQLDQGARQQNFLSQAAARQALANHVPGLLSGMPINDASGYMLPNNIMGGESKVPNSSQMFIADNMNFAQGRGSPGAVGSNILTNGYGQAIHPMGFTPQQFGQSLYGTPVSSSRGLLNQYPQLHGMPNNYTDVMAEAVRNQLEKAPVHSSPSNSFQAKSLFMNTPVQGLCGGAASGNFQQVNHPQNSIQAQEFSLRHEQGGWSSNFEEKTATQVGPSLNVTSLDPEEEKILFGTDDDSNLGASLGRIVGTGGPHGDPYDGNDQFGAFPSLQSGSWSALMQEAVQASSSGEGFREEWSGLTFQKTDTSIANTSIHNDVGKHQATWDNSNNFQSASSVNLRPSPFCNDTNSGPPFPTAPTFLHSNRTTREENNRVQTDDSHESLQQISVNEQNLQFNLTHRKKQFLEGRLESQIQSNDVPHGVWSKQMYEQSVKSADSASMVFTVQNNQGTSIHPGNVPLININRQPDPNPIGRMKTSEGPDDNRTLFAQNEGDLFSGIEPVKSDIGSSQIQSVPFSTSNFAAITNSNNLHANQGMNQHLPNRHQADLGKHVAYDSFVKSRGENVEEYINPPSKGQHGQDSSVNSGDPSLSVSDSQTSSCLSGWKTVGSRRFQSHPSENLGMNAESAYSPKDTAYSQSLPKSVIQQFKSREQGYADNSQLAGQGVSHAAKGRTTGIPRSINSPEESQYRSTVPMQTSRNMLELMHRDISRDNNAAGFGNSDLNSVHATDDLGASDGSVPHHPHPPSASQGFGLRLASPPHRRQVSNHDLQLRTSLLNRRQVEYDTEDKDRMQSASTGSDRSLHHAHEASPKEILEVRSDFYGQKHLEVPQVIPHGNFSAVPASNLPHMGHQLQMWKQKQLLQQQEHISNLTRREVMRSQSDVHEPNNRASFLRQPQISHNVALASQSAQISRPTMAERMLPFRLDSSADAPGHVSQFNSPNTGHSEPSNVGFYLLRTSAQQFPSVETRPVVQASARSGISQQTGFSAMLHNVWPNASDQQVVSGHQTNDQVNTGRSIPSELGTSHNSQQFTADADINPTEGKSLHETVSEGDGGTFMIGNASQEQGQLSKHHSDRNLGNVSHLNVSRGTQCPTVADSNSVVGLHGHTVLLSHVQNPNYSFLQQMEVRKSADSDASKRDEMMLKVELAASSNGSFPSDVKTLSFSLEENKERCAERTAQFVGREGSPHDICPSGQPDLQNQSQPLTSTSDFIGRNEHPMLTPQMSRSWLEQYRKYKNGQIAAMLADQKRTEASDELSPSLQLGGTGHDIVIRSKKRKTATSELLPWHQVISFGAQSLQSISMAEQGWAQATNRLLEKVEDAAELIEDGSLMPRTRRRLILTTQLMQQLLPSIPASILSAEVTSSYESVAYLLAKSALGDACCLISRPGSDSGVHLNNENWTSEKRRASEKTNEVFFSKVVENFIGRSRKLETDFTRLDTRTSILDTRLEWQEVERFSLVNRLGKYHARSQADSAESSSASQNAPRKIFPQRHVTSFSMLGNVPEGVQCLSL